MIPFPLLGGGLSKPTPPIPTGVAKEYTGAKYTGPDGDSWTWKRTKGQWLQDAKLPEDSGHPTYLEIVPGLKIGTDGSYRYIVGGAWTDVPNQGNPSLPMLSTDDGVNIGLSIVMAYPVSAQAGTPVATGGGFIVGTRVIGRDDLVDLYLLGYRAEHFYPNNTNPNNQNAKLILTNVKKDRIWTSKKNFLVQTDDNKVYAFGMNFYNQYGPWRSGVTSSSQPAQKISPWMVVSDIPDGSKIKDAFLGVSMFLYQDTDGKFWSKGINIGQFNDTDATIRSVMTEIPATRFPGFKKFYQSYNGNGAANDLSLANCCWYYSDTGLWHFGNLYGIADGTYVANPGATPPTSLPDQKVHIQPVGLPKDREPTSVFPGIPMAVTTAPAIAVWYEEPQEQYVMQAYGPYGSGSNEFDGYMLGRSFFPSSAPVGKSRSPDIDFNTEATIIAGYDGKYYASGTSTVANGLSSRTSPATLTDQKMDSSLLITFRLSDSINGKSQITKNDGKTILVADLAGGSNYFGNGTFWKPTATLTWSSGSGVCDDFRNIGTFLHGTIAAFNNSTWAMNVLNYNTVGNSAQGSSLLYYVETAGEGHITVNRNNMLQVGGPNIAGIFGAQSGFVAPTGAQYQPAVGQAWVTFSGTHCASVGTVISKGTYGDEWFIAGKDYWTAGEPVIPWNSGTPKVVRWDQRPSFPAMPNYRSFESALLGYTDDQGKLDQPFFMYRGTDGKYYAAGRNTTGCLGTGLPPTARDETRWTFQAIKGSEVFGNKRVKCYYGHGNASALLFLCEGKIYGLGTPNRMKWDDQGTIADPFFPGFNKRLNEITYLMDLPDVIWTRPIV